MSAPRSSLLLRRALRALANVKADEARHLDVLAQLGDVRLDQLIDVHVRVADVRLLEEELRLDDLLDAACTGDTYTREYIIR